MASVEVISVGTRRFWNLFRALPADIRKLAEKNYQLWCEDQNHPSLHFRRLKGNEDRYTVRIGDHYRALGGAHLGNHGLGLDRYPFGLRPARWFELTNSYPKEAWQGQYQPPFRRTAETRLNIPPVPQDPATRVRVAVEREFARRLTDVLHVSTYWGYERKITREFVEPIVREMARLLGWDEEYVRRQVAAGGITDDGDLTAGHAVPQN